jgi:hypothetical protein
VNWPLAAGIALAIFILYVALTHDYRKKKMQEARWRSKYQKPWKDDKPS